MILRDDEVLLRAIDENDAEVLMDLINDPEVENSVYGWSYPVSLSSQKRWIANLNTDCTVRYAVIYEDTMVGMAIISSIDMKNRTTDMNIKLIKSARGKGVASRAVALMVHYCFEELNLHCLTANVIERNSNSRKLWEKLGFKQDGVLRHRVFKNGNYHNVIAYSMIKEEFYERNRQ